MFVHAKSGGGEQAGAVAWASEPRGKADLPSTRQMPERVSQAGGFWPRMEEKPWGWALKVTSLADDRAGPAREHKHQIWRCQP